MEKSAKENLTPSKRSKSRNDGLVKIMKNKDLQIAQLESKISQIEKEYDKMENSDLEFDLNPKSPVKS